MTACKQCGKSAAELAHWTPVQASRELDCAGCVAVVGCMSSPDRSKLREDAFLRVCPRFCHDTDLKRLAKWLQLPPDWDPKKSLVIKGPSGAGKTRLLWHCIKVAVINCQMKVRHFTHAQLCTAMEEARMDGDLEDFMCRLARVDLLVVDDLGNGSMTDTQSARLMEVIDSRYRACLPIWITTQYGGNQFTEKAGAERATAILRRITNNALVLSDKIEPKREGK